MRRQDLLGSLRQFQRRVAVIGSVAYLIANNPGGLLAMSRGAGDRGKVKPWDLFVGSGGRRDLGRRPGRLEVAFGEGVGGDEVGDVDDAAYQVMVEPVTLVQPRPPSGPQFVERGGAIGFVLEKNRVRFDVSVRAAQRSGLKVSSKLLRVARSVDGGDR